MKLYLLSTIKLGDFYVLASDPHIAEERLKSMLDKGDYGFYGDREVVAFRVLASEVTNFPGDKPNFSSGHKLILPSE